MFWRARTAGVMPWRCTDGYRCWGLDGYSGGALWKNPFGLLSFFASEVGSKVIGA